MGDWPLLAALGTEELAERDDNGTYSAGSAVPNYHAKLVGIGLELDPLTQRQPLALHLLVSFLLQTQLQVSRLPAQI